jgi:hypothetical protein
MSSRRGRRRRGETYKRSDRGDFAAVRPRGGCEELEGDFHLEFSSSRRGLRSFTSLYSHTHRMWGNIGSNGTTADCGRRGGGRTRTEGLTAVVEVRVRATLRTRCAGLGFLDQLEAARLRA